MKRRLLGLGAVTAAAFAPLLAVGPLAAQTGRSVPYWASISENEARMRVGPSLDYPSNWIYRRRDLPVKVVQVLGLWRKVEDADGAQGWMHVRLLSDTGTGIVRAEVAPMKEKPNDGAVNLFRAQKGVVGRLSSCANGWCAFDVHGKKGFIRLGDIWGGTSK